MVAVTAIATRTRAIRDDATYMATIARRYSGARLPCPSVEAGARRRVLQACQGLFGSLPRQPRPGPSCTRAGLTAALHGQSVRQYAPVTEHDWSRFPAPVRRELERIQRRYSLVRRGERLVGRKPRSLANDALHVVLEWGPQARLSEVW